MTLTPKASETSKDLKRPRGIESYFIASPKKKLDESLTKKEEVVKPQGEAKVATEIRSELNITTDSISESNVELAEKLPEELRKIIQLEIETLHPSWFKALESQFTMPYFLKLKDFLNSEFTGNNTIFPPGKHLYWYTPDVYSWSRFTPVSEVKVIIIGQDPYHNVNQAHGLCFSVNKGNAKPPSLRNIFKELKNEYPDYKEPSHGYLGGWAAQGVLLLNAALTVRAHQANSHADKGWEQFTDSVIAHLNKAQSNLVFILWGSYAQKKGKSIDSVSQVIWFINSFRRSIWLSKVFTHLLCQLAEGSLEATIS
ncbi:uracil DNA glycosylase [Entomophthora muscae]|uniref:Uracil DNA glycosylase n=1 Tax=Entomophthora muscae TaxID=34485 RepID=A0ACC2UI04_9FUNG|nr:uracil DNA glycosylase [Entomophthora muscae]